MVRWQAAHDAVNARGEHGYTDPDTGRFVFTEAGLLARGTCCGAGCRHCPYAHLAVRRARPERTHAPTWRTEPPSAGPVDVLFWSGGKDSYLAWLAMQAEGIRPVVLVSTHDGRSGRVAHQEVGVAVLVEQAQRLGASLLTVPLQPDQPYDDAVAAGLDVVARCVGVRRVAFGDLHLEGVRAWREAAFGAWRGSHDAQLHLPVWHVPYAELLDRLEASGAVVEVSASTCAGVTVGQRFDRAFVAALPEGVDAFGEHGEFHTRVRPPAR